jgi:hypothetical protein
MNMPVPSAQVGHMLFGRYQSNQAAIGNRAMAAIGMFWTQMVDPSHFSDSWTRLEPIVRGIIDTHYAMSAADASNYYGLSRAVAGFYGGAIPGSNLDPEYLSGFTQTMGVGQFYHFLDDGKDAATSSVMARTALMGSSMRVVMNGGRNTVTGAAAGDDVALGWERIIEPRSCGYCSGLAASNGIRKTTSDIFHAHDYCQCLARVVFRGQDSANTDLAGQWAKATVGQTGKAAVAAWDQYWSGKNGSISNNSSSGPENAAEAPGAGAGNAAVVGQPV